MKTSPHLKLYAWTAAGTPYNTMAQIEDKEIFFLGDFDHIAENTRESNEIILTVAQNRTPDPLSLPDALKSCSWFLWCSGCEISGINLHTQFTGVAVLCEGILSVSAENVENILKSRKRIG